MTASKLSCHFELIERQELGRNTYLLRLQALEGQSLPPIQAGQFVQVLPPGGHTLLRRPISICTYLAEQRELWLLVARVGRGTAAIIDTEPGATLDLILPLGNSFGIDRSQRPLLIGGGVGIAPMLALARAFVGIGIRPTVLLGGRSSEYVVLREDFEAIADVLITTDDGSLGYRGRVTDHPEMQTGAYDALYCCGPHPMMRAVAELAERRGIYCEVSLENTMACGIGACLCCVQDTYEEGNVCVCTEGPIFNSKAIKW